MYVKGTVESPAPPCDHSVKFYARFARRIRARDCNGTNAPSGSTMIKKEKKRSCERQECAANVLEHIAEADDELHT